MNRCIAALVWSAIQVLQVKVDGGLLLYRLESLFIITASPTLVKIAIRKELGEMRMVIKRKMLNGYGEATQTAKSYRLLCKKMVGQKKKNSG